MAEAEQNKPRRHKKAPETVREKAQKESLKKSTPSKKSVIKAKIHKPLSRLRRAGAKEVYVIKTPDTKAGRFFGKRIHFVPKFLKSAFAELKQVTWPTKREAFHKTVAVFGFAIFFILFVQLFDLIFTRLVKEIILR